MLEHDQALDPQPVQAPQYISEAPSALRSAARFLDENINQVGRRVERRYNVEHVAIAPYWGQPPLGALNVAKEAAGSCVKAACAAHAPPAHTWWGRAARSWPPSSLPQHQLNCLPLHSFFKTDHYGHQERLRVPHNGSPGAMGWQGRSRECVLVLHEPANQLGKGRWASRPASQLAS